MNNEIKTVKWSDSASYRGWRSEEEVKKLRPLSCTTIGFLIDETDEFIVLSQTVADDGDLSETIVIPKICIIHE